MDFTYDEIVDIMDINYIVGSTKGFTLPPGAKKINDFSSMLKSLLLNIVKVNNTIDNIRL